ncbi:hypothetical protein [Nakamurella deserti]|uniref:hypothetical protein n=1 Tax=Nakamurella deserti TaxID=2164074 RepID=UPI00130042AE|nr:hypothetical protein [Nakamurella deserti]
MRAARVVGVVIGLVLLGGCGGADGASTTPGALASVMGTGAAAAGAPTKLQVTVPGLGGGGAAPVESSVADPAPVSSEGSAAPAPEPEDGTAVEASPAAPTSPAAEDTVDVQLVGCDDCQVLGTHADVVGNYSAALISQGGRAAMISVDPAGALVAVQAVPYGVTFAAQPDGRLACGAGGRCLVRAAQADGRAVLSAFGIGADGRWTDLSGSDGFVSATERAEVVELEDALGAAVQVTDGTTTVWNVLAWNGTEFATLGCGPGADAPDLAALDLAACLS